MTTQAWIVGIVALLLGLAFCFAGYRFFRILIACWGLFAGFLLGANIIESIFGPNSGFLTSVLAWIVGIVFGIGLGVLAYSFYTLAVILLGASVGYMLGVEVMAAFGLSSTGVWAVIAGIVLAIIFAALIVALNLTKLLIIASTSLGGASATVLGTLLLFGVIPVYALRWGAATVIIQNSWIWALSVIVLALLGLVAQIQSNRNYTLDYGQSMRGYSSL